MISRIAWRNILRNKRRSLILTASIIVGVVAIVLARAFVAGFMDQILANQIGTDVGYIQIHKAGYQSDPGIDNSISSPDQIGNILSRDSTILNFAERLRTFGLVSSAYNSSGVSIVGVIPGEEEKITTMHQYVVKGNYLGDSQDQIMISTSIAEKLKVGIGDKVVIMASQIDGSVGSEACRVCGIYETFNSGFDQSHVYVTLQTLRRMLNTPHLVSEFVINPVNKKKLDDVLGILKSDIAPLRDGKPTGENTTQGYEVLSYEDMLPLFVMQIGLYNQIYYVIYAIIAVAMIFGIVDVMLMAVMERTHEIGVTIAVGMADTKIFRMILTEALFLGVFGTLIGLAVSYFSCMELARTGWDLSVFAASLRSFGSGSKIYLVMDYPTFFRVLFFVPIVTVIGAVYPASKAVHLQPVEAIRVV